MTLKQLVSASLLGFAVITTIPSAASAQQLSVLNGTASSSLSVAINRAVVVESDTPFAELSVANPAIADIATLSDRTLYVLGKAPGRTTLTLLGPEGNLITNVEIRVSPDITEFKERLTEIMPGENIEVRTANNGIVLSGTVSSITKLERAMELADRYAPGAVSNMMMVSGTHQVMIKVRFAEMRRSVSKDLSVSLGLEGATSNIGANLFTNTLQEGSNPITLTDPADGTFQRSKNSNGVLGIGFGGSSLQAFVLLEALETKGLVRTLAEPNLVALSGQEAGFLAGGEYPIPVAAEGGTAVEYRPFGVELKFTPTVLDGDIIRLTMDTAVSSIDTSVSVQANGIAVNAFSKRASATTVELRDGESFAIAGLLEDDFRDLVGQVPWISDLPILGSLFRSTNYARRQSELVVIVTAHLVTPARGDAYVLSTDRIRPPTEAQLFLNGKLARGPGRNRNSSESEVARQDFSGSYGYVME